MKNPQNMAAKVHNEDTVFDDFVTLKRLTLSYDTFAGQHSQLHTKLVLTRQPAVVVLLVDEQRKQFVFVEQFRIGAFTADKHPWLLELVAGIIEKGESPVECATREVLEEAGVEARNLELVMEYMPTPGIFNENMFLFLAHVDASKVPATGGLKHEHEDIAVRVVDFEQAYKMLDSNELISGPIITALLWFRNQQR